MEEEVVAFLEPYRKLLSDNAELQKLKQEKSLREHVEILNQVDAFQKDVDDIDKRNAEREKVITSNAKIINCILQERIDDTYIPVPHQYQKQVIAAVEGLVDFTNKFPQLMEVGCQTPKNDSTEILEPLDNTVRQFETAIKKGENSLDFINQFRDHLESTRDIDETADETPDETMVDND